jgi:hypothetical protein
MENYSRPGSRRALQIVLGVLAAVPLASGLYGMLAGAAAWPFDQDDVTATLDGEFRFTNAFWFAAGLVVFKAIPRVERPTGMLRAALGTVFLGGLARLLAIAVHGVPHPVFLGALFIELVGVPVLLVWQARVAAASRKADREHQTTRHVDGAVDTSSQGAQDGAI